MVGQDLPNLLPAQHPVQPLFEQYFNGQFFYSIPYGPSVIEDVRAGELGLGDVEGRAQEGDYELAIQPAHDVTRECGGGLMVRERYIV